MARSSAFKVSIVVGDTLEDIPVSGNEDVGTLFYSKADGESFILLINAVTGVRAWFPFGCCAGGTGASGITGPTG